MIIMYKEETMSKKVLVKDLVIPAGTVFDDAPVRRLTMIEELNELLEELHGKMNQTHDETVFRFLFEASVSIDNAIRILKIREN